MTGMNWLYGPDRIDYDTSIHLRSLVVDPDTVREIALSFEERLGPSGLFGPNGQVEPNALETLADWDLQHLELRTVGQLKSTRVSFVRPILTTDDPAHMDFIREVAQKLLRDGKPRPNWMDQRPKITIALRALLVVAWLWVLIAERPAISLVLFGTLVTAACMAAIIPLRDRYWPPPRGPQEMFGPGHRIRTMNRTEFRSRRADRHADLRVGAFTGLLGFALGMVADYILSLVT